MCLLNATFIWSSILKLTRMQLYFTITRISRIFICMVQISLHTAASQTVVPWFTEYAHWFLLFIISFFSVWWEVICCNVWSGCFEKAISSHCAGLFLRGGARLFLFYQNQPLKLKDSAAAEAKWDFTPFCFPFLNFFFSSPWLFLIIYLSHTLCQSFSPGNA